MEEHDIDIKSSRKMTKPPIEAEKFVKLLSFEPLFITDNIDGVRFIEFERFDDKTATIEFGTTWIKSRKGFYFYYEIVDWKDYVDGEFVPLESPRRKHVIHEYPSTIEQYKEFAMKIEKSLQWMYNTDKIGDNNDLDS